MKAVTKHNNHKDTYKKTIGEYKEFRKSDKQQRTAKTVETPKW